MSADAYEHTWTDYEPGTLTPGMTVITGEDEPWGGKSSGVRVETVAAAGVLIVRTDRGTYFRSGRQTQLQPLPHPRRILMQALAD